MRQTYLHGHQVTTRNYNNVCLAQTSAAAWREKERSVQKSTATIIALPPSRVAPPEGPYALPPMVGQYASLGVLIPESENLCLYIG